MPRNECSPWRQLNRDHHDHGQRYVATNEQSDRCCRVLRAAALPGFLNRQPDAPGLAFWTTDITSCGTDTACTAVKRVTCRLPSSFHRVPGYGWLRHTHPRVAFSKKSAESATRLTYLELIRAQSQLGDGVVVGQAGADAKLEANKTLMRHKWQPVHRSYEISDLT